MEGAPLLAAALLLPTLDALALAICSAAALVGLSATVGHGIGGLAAVLPLAAAPLGAGISGCAAGGGAAATAGSPVSERDLRPMALTALMSDRRAIWRSSEIAAAYHRLLGAAGT